MVTTPPANMSVENDASAMPVYSIADHWLVHAAREIYKTYGDKIDIYGKGKSLLKFGQNPDVGTSYETIWQQGGDEVLPTTNAIDTISSSDAGDTQLVTIEGHTISGTDLTFVSQTATLNGQNKVVLGTPLARMTRLVNSGSTDFAGTVYGYEDDTVTAGVPQTAAKIHIKVSSEYNQSLKAQTAISSVDYWIITHVFCQVAVKTSAVADFHLEFKSINGVWRPRAIGTAASTGANWSQAFYPFLIIPPNHDVRVRAKASTTGVEVQSWVNGVLALKV